MRTERSILKLAGRGRLRSWSRWAFFLLLGSVAPAQAQMTLGNVGLFQVPTAELNETGTLMAGGNFLPKSLSPFGYATGNYFVNVTLFSFLELTYRMTLLRTDYMHDRPRLQQQDRGISVRVQLLRERNHWPALLVGSNDPQGTSFFGTVYGVATKNWTLGRGYRLGATVGYVWPLSANEEMAVQYKGVMAGVSVAPGWCPGLKLIAEYDSEGINAGCAATLWKHLTLFVFCHDGRGCSAGIRYEMTLRH